MGQTLITPANIVQPLNITSQQADIMIILLGQMNQRLAILCEAIACGDIIENALIVEETAV